MIQSTVNARSAKSHEQKVDQAALALEQASGPAPHVSVVLIFYNAAEFIREAIESVIAQEYEDFELVLVDDGSQDASTAIARQYASERHERVRYIHHRDRENRGMSASRNLGIAAARGDFIAFIDADDRWKPTKLREQLAYFDRFPEIDAAFGSANYWQSWCGGSDRLIRTGHVRGIPVPPPEAAIALYPLGRANAPCPSGFLIRRSAALRVGCFEETFTGAYEDQAFLAKLYLNSTVCFADDVWLDYRIHDQSCVAQTFRNGEYDTIRRYFLRWYARYLKTHARHVPLRLRMAFIKAYLPYALPFVMPYLRRLRQRLKRPTP